MSLGHHRRALQYCSWCPKLCRFCCPTAQAERRETVTPWGKMTLAGRLLEGKISPDAESIEALLHCFGCLHCRTHCRHGIDVPGALVEAREIIVGEGVLPQLERFTTVLAEWKNPRGRDLRPLLERQAQPGTLVEEAHAVLFAGCRLLEQEGKLGLLQRTLAALGVDYLGVFSGELCCGWVWQQSGDRQGFLEHARKVAQGLSRYRLVVAPCPACVHTLRDLYPALGLGVSFKVLHLGEFMLPLLEQKKPPRLDEEGWVFHDPCLLARHLEQTDISRRVLGLIFEKSAAKNVWSGADTFCCGAGGLVPYLLPEVSRQTARLRLEQLLACGDRIVTSCPGCVEQFSQAAADVQTCDLFELVARVLGVE